MFLTHARNDGAIPFFMAERNAAAAAGRSLLVEVDHPHHELWPDELYGRALAFTLDGSWEGAGPSPGTVRR